MNTALMSCSPLDRSTRSEHLERLRVASQLGHSHESHDAQQTEHSQDPQVHAEERQIEGQHSQHVHDGQRRQCEANPSEHRTPVLGVLHAGPDTCGILHGEDGNREVLEGDEPPGMKS